MTSHLLTVVCKKFVSEHGKNWNISQKKIRKESNHKVCLTESHGTNPQQPA